MNTPHIRARASLPIVLVLPLVLVNAAAIWGQAGWSFNHIAPESWTDGRRLALSLLFALAVESIGIYLAWEAHQALMANQSSGLLRLMSYAVGALVGYLNYSHFAGETLTPTPQAITFGLLSAISPWLWAIRSRSMNRDRLAELDMTDERGLKLSTARKIWHPWWSLSVIRKAAWWGETKPSVAVARWEAERAERRPRRAARVASQPLSEAPISAPPLPVSGDVMPAPAGRVPKIPAQVLPEIARSLKAQDPNRTAAQIGAWIGKGESTVRGYLRDHPDVDRRTGDERPNVGMYP